MVDIPVQGRLAESRAKGSPEVKSNGDKIRFLGGRASFIRALDNVSFELSSGEGLGLIGRNGSGKSTLLRVLAGFYVPTEGKLEIEGKISTLFSNNIGLENEASGLENIYFVCKLLGFSNREIEELLPDIVDFCELGNFLHMPFRTYSAGMKTRLGFAIATSIQPEILLVDEIFGAGDKYFRRKAEERISRLFDGAGILLMANHSEVVLRQYCQKVLWLDNGRVYRFGSAEEVLEEYCETKKKPS